MRFGVVTYILVAVAVGITVNILTALIKERYFDDDKKGEGSGDPDTGGGEEESGGCASC